MVKKKDIACSTLWGIGRGLCSWCGSFVDHRPGDVNRRSPNTALVTIWFVAGGVVALIATLFRPFVVTNHSVPTNPAICLAVGWNTATVCWCSDTRRQRMQIAWSVKSVFGRSIDHCAKGRCHRRTVLACDNSRRKHYSARYACRGGLIGCEIDRNIALHPETETGPWTTLLIGSHWPNIENNASVQN